MNATAIDQVICHPDRIELFILNTAGNRRMLPELFPEIDVQLVSGITNGWFACSLKITARVAWVGDVPPHESHVVGTLVIPIARCCGGFEGRPGDERITRDTWSPSGEARVIIERWRTEYNTFTPHSSLGYRTPAPETFFKTFVVQNMPEMISSPRETRTRQILTQKVAHVMGAGQDSRQAPIPRGAEPHGSVGTVFLLATCEVPKKAPD